MGLPANLQPLPTMPYDERPVELPLDIEECRTAIWKASGNVTKAAEFLKCPSNRLRNFVRKSQYLSREMEEAREQLVDTAEDNVREALEDEEDKARRDQMSRFVLGSQFARSRGWGGGAGPSVKVDNKSGGMVVIQWEDGTSFGGAEPPTIDGEVVDASP